MSQSNMRMKKEKLKKLQLITPEEADPPENSTDTDTCKCYTTRPALARDHSDPSEGAKDPSPPYNWPPAAPLEL